jgi:hypothetical protein
LAVSKSSLEFIALMARRGWSDENIRGLYDHALKNDDLCTSSRERWLKSEEEWYHGNSASKSGTQESADRN